MDSHQSAPVGLEWLPPSFEQILKRTGPGENDVRI